MGMAWQERVFAYCERGADPAFWAEPFNAVSNLAFLVVAAAAAFRLRRLPGAATATRSRRLWVHGLIALVAAIGVGSFLFHTTATRWAMLADVGPITAFMLAYLVFALRAFLCAGWITVALAVIGFLVIGQMASGIECAVPGAASSLATEPCLNGSLAYAPALVTLAIVGLLVQRRSGNGVPLLAGAGLLLISLTLRSIDRLACPATGFWGLPRGTHLYWHLVNALVLHLLLTAALRSLGADRTGQPDP